MATIEELSKALVNADKAGDADAARQLASAIRGMQGQGAASQEKAPEIQPDTGMPAGMVLDPKTGQVVDTNARAELLRREGGFMQGASDMAGQFAAGTPIVGEYLDEAAGLFGGDMGRENARAKLNAYHDANPKAAAALRVAGGINGAIPMAAGGLSLGANAATAGQGLGRIALGGAADGTIAGAAAGFGGGSGLQDRVLGAVKGGGIGLAAGGLIPYATAGVSTAAGALAAPVMARLRPESYAVRAIGDGLARSGATADDVAARLSAAASDGQDMFTVADAMGHAGQRMLSTVARTPNNERQAVVDALIARQSDQGRRVAQVLSDASGTPQTAAQYQEGLRAARAAEAKVNYRPVSLDKTAIDVTPAVATANRAISPAADNLAIAQGAVPTDLRARAGIEANEASIRDPIRQAVKEARSYLASDTITVTNVEKAFRAKTNIDQMIATATEKGQGGVVAELMPIQRTLDKALARTSRKYAQARDAYETASGRIYAVDMGRQMSGARTRIEDNIESFRALPDEASRQAARVGYFDPKIAKAESQAGSMSNSARPFVSESSRREIPAFAAPMVGDNTMQRLGREQRMFETANTALGGSKTADNIADAAEMSRFDPTVMATLFTQGPVRAVMSAVTQAVGEAKGMPPSVVERVARVLMETRPDVAREMLTKSAQKTQASRGVRAVANAMLTTLGSTAGAR